MKTFKVLAGVFAVSGAFLLTTSVAADTSEYVHFTRHRDSNGHLLAGPTQPQSQSQSLIKQKTGIPATPNMQEGRRTDWGMNAQEVKTHEPVQPVWELHFPILDQNEQRVAYRSQIEGIDTSLIYTFYEDRLAQANYWFEAKHDDLAEYVQDFHMVKNWIIQFYGKPAMVQEIWLDPLYRYEKSLWGQAVMRGHLKMVAEWQNATTHITLLLDGGDETIALLADFDSMVVVPPALLETRMIEDLPDERLSSTDNDSMEETEVSDPSEDQISTHSHPLESPQEMFL